MQGNSVWATATQYAIRHALATAVVVSAVSGLTVVPYFGLLAWAVLAGSPIGGPLALPFMLVAAIALSAVSAVTVLWPVTAVSEAACRRTRCSTRTAQIPIATLLLFAEVISVGIFTALVRHQPPVAGAIAGSIAGALLLIPLGIYWWTLQAADWLLGVGRMACRRLGGLPE